MSEYEYIIKLIYDSNGKYKSPTEMDDLHNNMIWLYRIYMSPPRWTDKMRDDVRKYIKESAIIIEKLNRTDI